MKKWIKILSIPVIIIIVFSFFLLKIIDDKPYFETEYYKNTISRLNLDLKTEKETKGKLFTGFGKVNITPTITQSKENSAKGKFNTVPLAGYSNSAAHESATGILDSIYTKALAIKVNDKITIFVSLDLLLMPPEVVENVMKNLNKVGLERSQIFFGATHTHASVGAWSDTYVGEESAGKYQQNIVLWLSNKITEAITIAISDMQLSQIGFGDFLADNYISNRLIGKNGRINPIFSFISIRQENGKSAVVGSFSAHSTCMSESNKMITGDYPGYWKRKLENDSIDMAIFFSGSTASHSPKGTGSGLHKAKFIGESLADSVITYLPKIQLEDSLSIKSISSIIEIPEVQVLRFTKKICLSSGITSRLLPKFSTPYIQVIKMNNFVWLTFPCEISGEYTRDIGNALKLAGYYSIFSNFNGNYLGYVIPMKYYNYDSYEPGIMSWFGPSFGEYLMELSYLICDSLTGLKL